MCSPPISCTTSGRSSTRNERQTSDHRLVVAEKSPLSDSRRSCSNSFPWLDFGRRLIEHPVHDDWLHSFSDPGERIAGIKAPSHLQGLHVLAIDLAEFRVANALRTTGVHGPFFRGIGRRRLGCLAPCRVFCDRAGISGSQPTSPAPPPAARP